jgi:hypothetical protein
MVPFQIKRLLLVGDIVAAFIIVVEMSVLVRGSVTV